MIFKKDKAVFVDNLSSSSFNNDITITKSREAYLLSTAYSTSANKALALEAGKLKKLIFSDNGNYTKMKQVANEFLDECQQLLNQAKQLFKQQVPLTNEIIFKRNTLIKQIEIRTNEISADENELKSILETQLSISPQKLIGFEDLTIPVLILTGLMDESFYPKYDEIHQYQYHTKKLFENQKNGVYGKQDELKGKEIYFVVHAYDYYSAYKVGEMMSTSDVNHFAISYGGPMKSNRWRTKLNWGNEEKDLGASFPEKYLLSQSILIGFLHSINKKVHIHILGCGSPIMILLSGALLPTLHSITFDSSSPLQDAIDGNIFSRNMALTKLPIEKLIAYHLSIKKPYYSNDIFYKLAQKLYIHSWDTLAEAYKISSKDNIQTIYKKVLAQPEIIRNHLPFFSPITSDEESFFGKIRVLRAGSNYSILRNICKGFRTNVHDTALFYKRIENEVSRFEKHSNSKWGESVRVSFSLTIDFLKLQNIYG